MGAIHVNWPDVVGLAVIAGVSFFLRYIYAPLKIRGTQTREREPRYASVELTQLSPEVSWKFTQAASQLVALSFTAVHATRQDPKRRQNSAVSLWVNRSARDSAQVIAVTTATHTGGERRAMLVTFRTEFGDRSTIVTTNAHSPRVFPPNPTVDTVICSDLYDVTLLYQLHCARVARDAAGRTATVESLRDGIAYLCNEHTETFQRLIKAGYYVEDARAGRYLATYRGAFLMTYRYLWPWKQINLILRQRKAERLLQELGFGGLEAMLVRQRSAALAAAGAPVPPVLR